MEGRENAEAEAIRGYRAAVRSALTDDGRPPLEASGLRSARRSAGSDGWPRRSPTERATVQTRFDATIASLARHRGTLGSMAGALDRLRKVTRSYRPGLFGCCDVPGLPRTNNDLEQFFGSYRYHERRCSGRKVACPGTVVRGPVRPVDGSDLVPSDLSAWRGLRDRLERRRAVRTLGRRFRIDPAAYLRSLEDSIINQALPS